jgi:hypothetical protein
MRLLWCKMNNYSIEELEPELINYQPEKIDINRMTLINENVPLVLTGLTLRNYRSYDEFYVCSRCGKVYWQGTHWQRRVNRDIIKENQSNADEEGGEEDDDGIVFYDAQSTL